MSYINSLFTSDSLRQTIVVKITSFFAIALVLFYLGGFLALVATSNGGITSDIIFFLGLVVFILLSGHIAQGVLRIAYVIQLHLRFFSRSYVPPYTTGSYSFEARPILPDQLKISKRKSKHSLKFLSAWWFVVILLGGYVVSYEPSWLTSASDHWIMKILIATSAVLLQLPWAILQTLPIPFTETDEYGTALLILVAISILPSAAFCGSLMQVYEEHLKHGLGFGDVDEDELIISQSEMVVRLQIIITTALTTATLYGIISI